MRAGRQPRAPRRMFVEKPARHARLLDRLARLRLPACSRAGGLTCQIGRVPRKLPAHAGVAQADAEFGVLPAVEIERFVESAGGDERRLAAPTRCTCRGRTRKVRRRRLRASRRTTGTLRIGPLTIRAAPRRAPRRAPRSSPAAPARRRRRTAIVAARRGSMPRLRALPRFGSRLVDVLAPSARRRSKSRDHVAAYRRSNRCRRRSPRTAAHPTAPQATRARARGYRARSLVAITTGYSHPLSLGPASASSDRRHAVGRADMIAVQLGQPVAGSTRSIRGRRSARARRARCVPA